MISPTQLQVLAARRETPRIPFPGRRRRSGPAQPDAEVTIRFARAQDAGAVARLEAMEDRSLTDGPRLVAHLDGAPVAALAIADDGVVADPFEPTVAAVELLRLRARQLRLTAPAPARPARLTLLERLAAR